MLMNYQSWFQNMQYLLGSCKIIAFNTFLEKSLLEKRVPFGRNLQVYAIPLRSFRKTPASQDIARNAYQARLLQDSCK